MTVETFVPGCTPSEASSETLDLPGLACPMPVLKTKKRLAALAAGARLRVISTDPHSLADLAEFCRQTGHALLEQHEETTADGVRYVTDIRKRCD